MTLIQRKLSLYRFQIILKSWIFIIVIYYIQFARKEGRDKLWSIMSKWLIIFKEMLKFFIKIKNSTLMFNS